MKPAITQGRWFLQPATHLYLTDSWLYPALQFCLQSLLFLSNDFLFINACMLFATSSIQVNPCFSLGAFMTTPMHMWDLAIATSLEGWTAGTNTWQVTHQNFIIPCRDSIIAAIGSYNRSCISTQWARKPCCTHAQLGGGLQVFSSLFTERSPSSRLLDVPIASDCNGLYLKCTANLT